MSIINAVGLTFLLIISQAIRANELQSYTLDSLSSYLHTDKAGAQGELFIDRKAPSSVNTRYEVWFEQSMSKAPDIILTIAGLNTKDGKNIKFSTFLDNPNIKFPFKVPGFEFVHLLENGNMRVVFEDFNSKFLIVNYHGRKIFLKTFKDFYKKEKLSFVSLFSQLDSQIELDKKLNEFLNFRDLISGAMECISKRSDVCFSKYFASADKKIVEESLRKNFTRRYVWENQQTCNIYLTTRSRENEEDNHIPAEAIPLIKKEKSDVWEALRKTFNFELSSSFVSLDSTNLSEGINRITVFKRAKKNRPCGNMFDVILELNKINDQWKIKDLVLSPDPDKYEN